MNATTTKRAACAAILAAAVACFAQPAAASLLDGLVAYYPFSGSAEDASGHGNHGTAFGPTLAPDRFGIANSAYDFDGTNDFVLIPGSSSLSLTGEMSLVAWFKARSLNPNNALIWKETVPDPDYALTVFGDKIHASISRDDTSWTGLEGNGLIAPDQWHLVVFTYDLTTMRIFLDGQLDSTRLASGAVASDDGVDISIGAWYNNGSPATQRYWFNGLIDDVRIYDRALAPSEVAALYDVPEPGTLALLGLGLAAAHARRRRTVIRA